MSGYRVPQHRAVAALLDGMDTRLLDRCHCYFGGGTAIVLDLDEYRVSRDIDFMCSDADGYREIRTLVAGGGFGALFKTSGVKQLREPRMSGDGIRGLLEIDDTTIKIEILREGRIHLDQAVSTAAGPARLSQSDQVAEKLLANADRGTVKAECYRDAIDLGMIVVSRGLFPDAAVRKAEGAYGTEIRRKLEQVLDILRNPQMRQHAAGELSMDLRLVTDAAKALAGETRRVFPGASPKALVIPPFPQDTHFASLSLDGKTVRVQRRPPRGGTARLDNPLGPAMVHLDKPIYAVQGECMSHADWLQRTNVTPISGPSLKS